MKVLIVTELRVYREGLALALGRHADFEAIATAAPDEVLSDRRTGFQPHIVLLDLMEDRKLELARWLAREVPSVTIVGLGAGQGEPEVLACAEAGVHGIVSRDATLEELVETMFAAMRGEFRCSAGIAGAMARRLAAISVTRIPILPQVNLTIRQTDIVRCLEAGLSNKEIARQLGIQLGTVKNHVHLLLEKLGAARRSEAIARLRQSGWFNRGP